MFISIEYVLRVKKDGIRNTVENAKLVELYGAEILGTLVEQSGKGILGTFWQALALFDMPCDYFPEK